MLTVRSSGHEIPSPVWKMKVQYSVHNSNYLRNWRRKMRMNVFEFVNNKQPILMSPRDELNKLRTQL